MYIDTKNRITIINSLCEISKKNEEEILTLIKKNEIEMLKELIVVDEVLIHHLSRRIKNTKDKNTYDLHTLLTFENEFTLLLNKHGFEFKKQGDDVEMFYKGKAFLEDDSITEHDSYGRIKQRLYYGDCGFTDSCINGYAIGVPTNCNYNDLISAPEFIKDISRMYDKYELSDEYEKKSKFAIYSYRCKISNCNWSRNTNTNTNDFMNCLFKIICNFINCNKIEERYIITKDIFCIDEEHIVYIDEKALT